MLEDISSVASNGDFDSRKDRVRDYLWNEWHQLFSEHDDSQSIKWFERLWELQANDSARHYHTAVHLQEMLLYFHFLRPQFLLSAEQQRAVILAIFFHDAIYDASSNTNEEDSVKLFQSFETSALVDDMILATKAHHSVDPSDDSSVVAFFLDLDLSVLGKTYEAYQQYAILIRKEYSHVPHDTYCQKRADILDAFLQQKSIYKTSLFREMFEEQARSNLAAEIRLLRQGVIPEPK
jgi:predicted metal-dependent HD superfamily phosphohydrolase